VPATSTGIAEVGFRPTIGILGTALAQARILLSRTANTFLATGQCGCYAIPIRLTGPRTTDEVDAVIHVVIFIVFTDIQSDTHPVFPGG
jgi:hypothetical protein